MIANKNSNYNLDISHARMKDTCFSPLTTKI